MERVEGKEEEKGKEMEKRGGIGRETGRER